MTGQKACVPLVIVAVLGAPSAAWSGMWTDDTIRPRTGDIIEERTHAIPCSLDGFNPTWHPEFNDPANARQVAKNYGFIKSPDGTWHLDKSCARAGAVPVQAPSHGLRRNKKREPQQ
jgi:hypothetical protein